MIIRGGIELKEYLVPSMEIIYIEVDDIVRTSGGVAPTLGENENGGNAGTDKFF